MNKEILSPIFDYRLNLALPLEIDAQIGSAKKPWLI
jgi:hypothetical protein